MNRIAIALREVRRILESSGIVLIIELLARSYAFSLLMFYTTMLCAELGIDIDLLDIHSKVVTFFLTEAVLKQITSKVGFAIEESESSIWKLLKLKLGRNVTYSLSLPES